MVFFADDGIQFSQSIDEARYNIKLICNISKKYGLEINKEKSKIIIFNLKHQPDKIEDIEVKKKITYLGVEINNKKDKKHKKSKILQAQRMSNLTYGIIHKSCNKLMIGKTFWKNIVIPSILHSTSIIDFTKSELNKLQIIENNTYRIILGGNRFTPNGCLRGEVGASSMETRIKENKIRFLARNQAKENKIVNEIIEEMLYSYESDWMKRRLEELREFKIRFGDLKTENIDNIKAKIKQIDMKGWKTEMENKTSLYIYRNWKKELGKNEKVYDNNPNSKILFLCRTNTLRLNDRNRFTNENTSCPLCKANPETLVHFLLDCPSYAHLRIKIINMQLPQKENKEDIIGELLFSDEGINEKKRIIYEMWRLRERRMNAGN